MITRQSAPPGFNPAARVRSAWQRAMARVAQGYLGDPARGRQTFRDYVEKTWLPPNHEIEAVARQMYTYTLRCRILPERVDADDRHPSRVRPGVGRRDEARGSGPAHDEVRDGHPQRHLYYGAQRPGDVAASVQGREDPAGAGPAAHHHHSGAIRSRVRVPAR
jgi:hypothetical protein